MVPIFSYMATYAGQEMTMPRLKPTKHAELEAFWRAHVDSWRRSDLNQQEYCEVHGLPLKRFEGRRAKYWHEDRRFPRNVLYRRNGELGHMSEEPPLRRL